MNFGDEVKFKHSVTGKYILLDVSSQYTQFNCRGCEIISQIELHAEDQDDTEQSKISFQIVGGLAFEASPQVE